MFSLWYGTMSARVGINKEYFEKRKLSLPTEYQKRKLESVFLVCVA